MHPVDKLMFPQSIHAHILCQYQHGSGRNVWQYGMWARDVEKHRNKHRVAVRWVCFATLPNCLSERETISTSGFSLVEQFFWKQFRFVLTVGLPCRRGTMSANTRCILSSALGRPILSWSYEISIPLTHVQLDYMIFMRQRISNVFT